MQQEETEARIPPPKSLQALVGSLVLGADHPLSIEEIRACLAEVGQANAGEHLPGLYARATPDDIRAALQSLATVLRAGETGFELVETGGCFAFRTEPGAGRWLRQLLKIEKTVRLSPASLETLAIIAYRQPISKAEIESVRGVAADHIVRALQELSLVKPVGRSELPGRPYLYGTTPFFLEHFGLRSLDDLDRMDPTLQRSDYGERLARHSRNAPPGVPVQEELAGLDGSLVAAEPDA